MTHAEADLFTLDHVGANEVFVPTSASTGGWGADLLRGPAVTGLLARAMQTHVEGTMRADTAAPGHAVDEFRPVRVTFDLFRPPRAVPSTARVRTVRRSRRTMLVDAELVQHDMSVARSQALLLLVVGGHLPDTSWQPLRAFEPPDARLRSTRQRLFKFAERGWTPDPSVAPGDEAGGQVWLPRQNIIEGEDLTPFQAAASAADVTNLAVHWSSEGLGYINADATLILHRLPRSLEIGIAAVSRIAAGGVAVGHGVAFDEYGSFATTAVCGLAQDGNRTARPTPSGRSGQGASTPPTSNASERG